MNDVDREFDRERAHRKSRDLSDLKDEPDEKNDEHIEQARRDQDETGGPGAGQQGGGEPREPKAG
ncbi:hypothetical protein [Kitasatospora sp. NBC_01539]|uniref:hypothetical protein n=1 Tax=Kitasatospora sp. NBC_01539 TaxID=2903577 RepID=UPI0038602CB5